MFVKFLIVFLLVVTGNCFILDGPPSNGEQIQTPNQFLTVTEFLLEKKTLQQETDSLRRDLDKTISLLDTQLKQKFDLLEHKVAENTQKNDSSLNYVPLDMYLALEQKFNQLQNENNGLTRDYNLVKNELQLLLNASSEHDRKIRDLQQLGNIKPLQDIGTLQHAVQINTATIQSLSMNERARSQDFLALYNLTTVFKNDVINQLTGIQTNHNSSVSNLNSEIQATEMRNNLTVTYLEGIFKDMNNKLVSIEANYNVTIDEIRSKIDTTEKKSNSSIVLLKKQIDEKVALTSHPSSDNTVKAGNVIKFNDVKFSVGISNLSTYKSSGKFICETSGLYMISTSIATHTAGNPEYGIVHNGTYISRTEIGQESSSAWRTGTSVVSRYLDVKDTIWVNAITDITPEASIWSQFTIIKIK